MRKKTCPYICFVTRVKATRRLVRLIKMLSMKPKMLRSVLAGMLLCIGVVLMAHVATAQEPDAYCKRVGNDDRVKPVRESLVPEARRLFYTSPDVSAALVQKSTVFRCMDGNVWLCNYGANLICDKADVSRVSKGAAAYCKQPPGSDLVPMSATGHATIYTWKCVGSKARILDQWTKVDGRGFIAENWKRR